MSSELKNNSPLKYEELSDSELEILSGGYPGEDTKNPNDDPPGQQDVGNRDQKIDIKQWQKRK